MYDLLRVEWHFSESGFDELRILTVILKSLEFIHFDITF